MANQEEQFKKVVAHAKEYGYVVQSSEIYDGLSAVYDYSHNGVELKNNIREYWWKAMVQFHENIVGIDAAILMHPTTWKASGHVDAFNDPLIDNKDSKKRYRADVLLEDYAEKLLQKAINRGDYIWAASNPLDKTLLFKDIKDIPNISSADDIYKYFLNPKKYVDLTGFGKEVKTLIDNGYKFNAQTKMFIK